MRVKVICKDQSGLRDEEYHRYASCGREQNDVQNVIIFQCVMAVVGGLAFWGVQVRRQYSMTQFDHRRQRYDKLLA